jgi:hypothetical protein
MWVPLDESAGAVKRHPSGAARDLLLKRSS